MKDRMTTAVLFLLLFVVLILSATANVLQSVQTRAINQHVEALSQRVAALEREVEVLGLEADTYSVYMRDQNAINEQLIAMME